jgi:hypothetical protein
MCRPVSVFHLQWKAVESGNHETLPKREARATCHCKDPDSVIRNVLSLVLHVGHRQECVAFHQGARRIQRNVAGGSSFLARRSIAVLLNNGNPHSEKIQ